MITLQNRFNTEEIKLDAERYEVSYSRMAIAVWTRDGRTEEFSAITYAIKED